MSKNNNIKARLLKISAHLTVNPFLGSLVVDDSVPTLVYVSNDRRRVLSRLNPTSAKLLDWCLQEFVVNQDWFWLDKKRYMDETGTAYNTYKKSIAELQNKGLFLKTSYTDVFWINPYYYFRGDRQEYYKEKIK